MRLRALLSALDRFGPEQLAEIRRTAAAHRASLSPLEPPWTFDEDAG